MTVGRAAYSPVRMHRCLDRTRLARALNLMGERYLLDSFGREPFGDPATAVSTLEIIWLRVVGGHQAQ
jgi:hypothetical protein